MIPALYLTTALYSIALLFLASCAPPVAHRPEPIDAPQGVGGGGRA